MMGCVTYEEMTESTSSSEPFQLVSSDQEELFFLTLLPSDSALLALVCQRVSAGHAPTIMWLQHLLKTYSAVSKRRLLKDLRSLTILQWLVVVPTAGQSADNHHAVWSQLYAAVLSC